jgi:hypothetical protein
MTQSGEPRGMRLDGLLALEPMSEGRVIQVAVEVPFGGGGSRVDQYEVQPNGALVKWHYCRPPHERDTSISSPAVWTCPECSTRWALQVRTYYVTETQDRDDANNYDY